jgi:HK97 family phage prohead protease
LQDIQIRNDGSGRTVEAYAAVFNHETNISDQQGRYREQVDPQAFDDVIARRGTKFGVFYNHGMTLMGTPSDLASVPLGSPIEAPRADGIGLITTTRYNRNPLADQVLEAIRNGDITGQSFSGRFADSSPGPDRSSGKYRPMRDGSLVLVTRKRIELKEYGPTPIPAYDVPMVLGVRARMGDRGRQLARVRDHFSRATLAPDETQALTMLLAMLAGADAGLDPIVDALCAADCALDAAQLVVASMLGVPDPDVEDVGELTDEPMPMDSAEVVNSQGVPPGDVTGGEGQVPASGTGRSGAGDLPRVAEEAAARDGLRGCPGRLTVAQRARVGHVLKGARS